VDATCAGNDGSVTATFSGGSGTYEANIDGGAFTASTSPRTFGGLAAGPHTVIVRDANDISCTITRSITVGQPPALDLSLTKSDVSCAGNDGSVTATFSGGSGTYEANIDGGAFAPATSPKTFGGLSDGSHTVIVRDANDISCTITRSITVGAATACSHLFPTQTTCCNYLYGNTSNFQQRVICYTVVKGKVSQNVNPGVFFYYGDFTLASNVSGTVVIRVHQEKNSAKLGLFAPTNDNNLRITIGNCNNLTTPVSTSISGGDVIFTLTNPLAGKYVVSVKYDSKSIVGTDAGGSPTVTYTFSLLKDNVLVPNSIGQLDASAAANCSSVTPTPDGSCPAIASPAPASIVSSETKDHTGDITVNAYPNPYTNVVNFQFSSPKAGNAVLEVYDMMGRKLAVVYQGNVSANIPVSVKYNVPSLSRVALVYKLTVDTKSVRGNILPDK
jgi:hypothetical protein